MKRFTDAEGRVWQIKFTVSSVRRLHEQCGVLPEDLVKSDLKPLADLVGNPVRLIDAVWALIEPQADSAGVSSADFGEACYGDVLTSAAMAFVEALPDFFSSPGVRALLAKAAEAIREVHTRNEEALAAAAMRLSTAELIRSASATNTPVSSASTPAGTPSAS